VTASGVPAWRTAAGTVPLQAPLFLGILNITPDSFSDGGNFMDPARALDQARSLVAQGAGMLDLGAESTRPGAAEVSPSEEWARLEPVLKALRDAMPGVPLSLDTRHGDVAARGIALGVSVLNDVTGFQDPEILHVACNSGCGLIAMRSRTEGGALVMPPYGLDDPATAGETFRELRFLRDRLLQAGIAPQRILLDPGFGFGTTFNEDLALWDALPSLPAALDWPVERFCIGISRKRFLAWRAGSPALPPAERDALGAKAHLQAIRHGFRIFRTHAVSTPVLRPAQPADAEEVARVQVASWRATYPGILPESLLASLSTETQAAAFTQILATAGPDYKLWLLEARGRVMGFAAAGPARDAAGSGEIHAIYLLPEAWDQGLGHALLERALEGLRESGFPEARLWVLERNTRGRRFYERYGWQLESGSRTEWMDGIALREVQYRMPLVPEPSGQ